MDRLIAAIKAVQNPSVIGLDPTTALVPPQVFDAVGDDLDAAGDKTDAGYASESGAQQTASRLALGYFEFNRAVIDAVADIVPAVKVQIAMYEALGPAGVDAYTMTCEYAQQQGLYVIGDIKRGDIGSTAAAYAQHLSGLPRIADTSVVQPADADGIVRPADAGHIGHAVRADRIDSAGRTDNSASIADAHRTAAHAAEEPNESDSYNDLWHEDAVTVNPYLGADGITPFVDAAKQTDKGIFVLVRTSNPSSKDIQELELASRERFYEHVADLVNGWGATRWEPKDIRAWVPSWARPIRRKAVRCANACRTRSFWFRALVRKAAPRRMWLACSMRTGRAPSSTPRAASSQHGRNPADTAAI